MDVRGPLFHKFSLADTCLTSCGGILALIFQSGTAKSDFAKLLIFRWFLYVFGGLEPRESVEKQLQNEAGLGMR